MKIFMVCPAPRGSRKGNRVTAERWSALLTRERHRVTVASDWDGEACDLLLALHARKSHAAVRRYREAHPSGPLIVTLTGTDLYRDLPLNHQARQSIHWADRLIVLHARAAEDLPANVRHKVRVVLQSAAPLMPRPARSSKIFQVCVLGHLRNEKDPSCAAIALRRLPHLKQIRLIQAGKALSQIYATWARAAMRRDSRYRWLGEVSGARARRLLASSKLMVISSRLEGGANVVSEAIVNGVPILASKIPGNIGLLGEDYPGYFRVGDPKSLAAQIELACSDEQFYRSLERWIARLAPRFRPTCEQAALSTVVGEAAPKAHVAGGG
jgi:putative glycosyltransferase (TIGR04348 family)